MEDGGDIGEEERIMRGSLDVIRYHAEIKQRRNSVL